MFCKKVLLRVKDGDSLEHVLTSVLFTSLCNGSEWIGIPVLEIKT